MEFPTNRQFHLNAWAVDIGYSQTKLVIPQEGSPRCEAFPSFAPVVLKEFRSNSANLHLIKCPNGMSRYVGPDAVLACGGETSAMARKFEPDFCMEEEYWALFLGSLAQLASALRVEESIVIDVCFGGLPVDAPSDFFATVAHRMKGKHKVPHWRKDGTEITVTVQHAAVVEQPKGAIALCNFDRIVGRRMTRCLVIDVGGGTTDWWVAEGLKTLEARCGSAAVGTLMCVTALAQALEPLNSHKAKPYAQRPQMLKELDDALRLRDPNIYIGETRVPLDKYLYVIEQTFAPVLKLMMRSVDGGDDLHVVKLTGGGASLVADLVRGHFRHHKIEVVEDPRYENVLGFYKLALWWAEKNKVAEMVAK